jgi:hypothetical protein
MFFVYVTSAQQVSPTSLLIYRETWDTLADAQQTLRAYR